MHADLLKARNELRMKLLSKAEIVIKAVHNENLNNLKEIGLFGSLANDKFTCNSDADIYLEFDGPLPSRQKKGMLRSVAEENNCDIVFINSSSLSADNPGLLVDEIFKNKIVLWRK